ncbi:MAG TPA: hypothetical protein VFK25_08740, partial [Candidatus Binatia bacterium]|nr:hypothetical protein [Candidatus Binatia bacterium]
SSLDLFANSARCHRLEENVFVMVRRDQHRGHGGPLKSEPFPLMGKGSIGVLSSNPEHPYRVLPYQG